MPIHIVCDFLYSSMSRINYELDINWFIYLCKGKGLNVVVSTMLLSKFLYSVFFGYGVVSAWVLHSFDYYKDDQPVFEFNLYIGWILKGKIVNE